MQYLQGIDDRMSFDIRDSSSHSLFLQHVLSSDSYTAANVLRRDASWVELWTEGAEAIVLVVIACVILIAPGVYRDSFCDVRRALSSHRLHEIGNLKLLVFSFGLCHC